MTAAEFPSISLVIPCYNEQERITHLFEGIKEFIVEWHGPFEIIIVNDGSNDNTLSAIKAHSLFQNLEKDKLVHLLHNNNKGKGGALQVGITAAQHSFILTCDADMATHPLEILQWQRRNNSLFTQNIIGIASRMHKESELILTSNRRSVGNLFNTIVRLLTSLPHRDTQCGFKLYPSAIAKQLFTQLHTMGWAHDVEILLRAKKNNCTVEEFPITWNEREASKINIVQDGLKMLLEVIHIKWQSIWYK